jgi:cyclic pyranopterin phosphate synthase
LKYLVDAILKYDLKKHIRLGLAQPIPGRKNECLSLYEVRKIAKTLRNQLDLLEKHRITLGFDCGMSLCIFSNEDIGRLFKLNRGRVMFSCGPAIDIGPDLQVWACFPLNNYEKKSLYDFDNMDEIRKYFAEKQKSRRQKAEKQKTLNPYFQKAPFVAESRKGIFEECSSCVYLEENLCAGGCLAHLIN